VCDKVVCVTVCLERWRVTKVYVKERVTKLCLCVCDSLCSKMVRDKVVCEREFDEVVCESLC
jgi:hypothetical protein